MAPAGSRSDRLNSLAALIGVVILAGALAVFVEARNVAKNGARGEAHASPIETAGIMTLPRPASSSSTSRPRWQSRYFSGRAAAPRQMPAPHSIDAPPTSARLLDHFVTMGYTLEHVRANAGAVPRVYLARLPRDLPQVDSSDARKRIFLKAMLPLLLAENERILADRERVMRHARRLAGGRAPQPAERAWLERIAAEYDVAAANLDELIRRLDAVPPSLSLAQAALESGWGTSRAAQRSHAMFGQMSFRIVGEQTIVEIKAFDDLAQAVAAYARNLNTHRAYIEFRARRAAMRAAGHVPDGAELALHLLRYSERKDEYVRAVRALIRANDLGAFDAARLAGRS
jgi:Bax protein